MDKVKELARNLEAAMVERRMRIDRKKIQLSKHLFHRTELPHMIEREMKKVAEIAAEMQKEAGVLSEISELYYDVEMEMIIDGLK